MQTPAGMTTTANQARLRSWSGSGCRFAACLALPVVLTLATAGCKSGSSMGNSWWAFGMGGPDPATLADAPPFEGDITKPSATATPYPTTATPESYALAAGDAPAAGQLPPATGTVAKTAQPPVTYGMTPPPAAAVPAQPTMTPPAGPSTIAASTPETGVAPQVGPYQTIPSVASSAATATAPPPAGPAQLEESAPMLPQPSSRFGSPSTPSGLAGAAPAAGSRYAAVADQRVAEAPAAAGYSGGGSRFSSPPAVTAPVAPMLPDRPDVAPTVSQSRYGRTSGSAFTGGEPSEPPGAGSGFSGGAAQPAAFPRGSELPEAIPSEPVAPSRSPRLPAPPPSSRRRDPGYRPGGTSSYRTTEPIYAGRGATANPAASQSFAPADVSPASFEAQINAAGVSPQALPGELPAGTGPATSP